MLIFAQAKSLEGEVLTVITPGGSVPLTVLRVYERDRRGLPPEFNPIFHITLRGPPGVLFPQSCYRVEHPAFGALDLGLGPTQHDVETDAYLYGISIG